MHLLCFRPSGGLTTLQNSLGNCFIGSCSKNRKKSQPQVHRPLNFSPFIVFVFVNLALL